MSALRPILIVVGIVTALFAAVAIIPSATAATVGVGVHGITPEGGFLGNHVAPDGSRVYCIDSDREWPIGATGSGSVVTSLSTDGGIALTSAVIRRLDLALARYGQTDDPIQAAAVNAYVYAWTSRYADQHGAGRDAGLHYINGHAAVERAFLTIWRETESAFDRPTPNATVSITVTGPREAIVTVVSSASGVGEVSLEGAVSADSGQSTIPVTGSTEIPVTGTPELGSSEYAISARLTLRASTRLAAVRLYSTGSQQRTIRDAGVRPLDLYAAAQTGPIALPFSPVLTSKVAEAIVTAGAPLIDTLTVTADAGPPWPHLDGAPVPVVAQGTLYGPFPTPPTIADEPPADAPIAGTETLTLTGPGEYRSSGSVIATLPGHYTWVWRIDAADQPVEVQATLPTGYRFADRFGLPDETLEVAAPQLAATGVAPTSLALAGALMGAGALLGNIARRRALRSA